MELTADTCVHYCDDALIVSNLDFEVVAHIYDPTQLTLQLAIHIHKIAGFQIKQVIIVGQGHPLAGETNLYQRLLGNNASLYRSYGSFWLSFCMFSGESNLKCHLSHLSYFISSARIAKGRIRIQSNHISFPPIPIVVRCIFHTVIIEALHHVVQYAMPHLLKPFGLAKPLYDCGADCVVCTDKCSAKYSLCQCVVSETTQRPDLRAVIGPIYTCCHIAALAVAVVIRSEHSGVAGACAFAAGITVVVTAE